MKQWSTERKIRTSINGPRKDKEFKSKGTPGQGPESVQVSDTKTKTKMAYKSREPPAFISETKSFATYKRDLRRWAKLTDLEDDQKADMVVHCLDGHSSGIKEKIDTQIEEEKLSCDEGIENLLAFLEGVYEVDEWSDSYEKYIAFERCTRAKGQTVQEFLSSWENCYTKMKKAGCEMSDQVLAYKLLSAMNLKEMECKLVLTGVDYNTGKTSKNLLAQMMSSLKKFVGHSVIQSTEHAVKVDPVYMTKSEMEKCLLSYHKKGGGGGGGGRSRTRSNSLPESSNNYKGKKNPLGSDFKPLKCFKCKCDHEEKCSCPCIYHMANKCPNKVIKYDNSQKADLPLFMRVNSAGLQVEHALFMLTETAPPLTMHRERCGEIGGEPEEVVLLTEKLEKLCLVTGSDKNRCLIDCACPNTVTGTAWLNHFISQLSEKQKQKMEVNESQRVYKFGGGEVRPSRCVVRLPCNLAGKNVSLTTEVVDADIPLLIGNSSLEKANAVLHIAPCKVELMGTEILMEKTDSGHFSIEVKTPNEAKETEMCLIVQQEMCLVVQQEELTEAKLEKLHHYWGHTTVDKLSKLIQNAGKLDREVKRRLEKIRESCMACQLYRNRVPAPAVSIPRATKVNQIVTVDLKEWDTGKHRYILYFVDMFSRFVLALFIPNKQAVTIGEAMLEKWISVFGPPGTCHSDRGGEFLNEDLTQLCEYLNTKKTATAAYSPNQNGCNESNHAVVDRMLQKMLMTDPTLKPEVALCWAVNAKNSLTNYQGFSPSQLVFGENPRLPALYSAGPPGHEEVVMSKSMADHINAMHLGREAFIECEADRVLKTALKKRVYARNVNIGPGDWIYFKNKSKRWEGPVKVTTCSGKLLYAVRAGSLLTINTDHAVLVKYGEEILERDVTEQAAVNGTAAVGQAFGVPTGGAGAGLSREVPEGAPVDRLSSSQDVDRLSEMSSSTSFGGPASDLADGVCPSVLVSGDSTPPTAVGVPASPETVTQDGGETDNLKISYEQIKRHNLIRFKQNGDTEWTRGLVGIRAGKATTKSKGKPTFKHHWNITNMDTNHTTSMNTELFELIEVIPGIPTEDDAENIVVEDSNTEEACFAVNIPRWRHGDRRCVEAKESELKNFDEFGVYEVVRDDKQVRLGTQWVLTERIKAGEYGVKARLTIRGDQENTEGIRKDSPTVRKPNIKVLLMICAKEGFPIQSSDVSAAFLQSVPIERDVFVLPQKERREPGKLWRLTKTVYGLSDASRGFYMSFSGEITKLGCCKSKLDPAMFVLLKEDNSGEEEPWEKQPLGAAVSHVDDVLHGGGALFKKKVMEPLFKKFKFGSHEDTEFRYVGINFRQLQDGSIQMDQDHYVEALEGPDMDTVANISMEETMGDDGQKEFRSAVAKLNCVGYQSRPDVCFDAKSLSTKFGKATKTDLRAAARRIVKLKATSTKMMIPNLGNVENWVLVGHGDAGIKTLPDKMTSCGGQVILLCNRVTDECCVLLWRSKKIVRKVTSSLAGETLAMIATIGEVVYIKAVLREMYGKRLEDVPTVIVTDANNLYEAVHSTSLVEDAWLRTDIAAIQDAVESGVVTLVCKVGKENMLADCLTKPGASATGLLEVLRTGHYKLFEGWKKVLKEKKVTEK